MNKDFTALMLVIDQSGSMGTIREESQQALDGLIKAQKEEPGKLAIKLVTFNHKVTAHNLQNAEDFEGVTLAPEGMTALHDAMGSSITLFAKEIEELEEKPGKVIVVVLTDGMENSSVEYATISVKMLVEEYKTAGWEFLFLGANQDAVFTAQQFGIAKGSALTYEATAEGITESINATTRYLGATRSGLKTEFSEEERAKSGLTDL